MYLVFDIGGTFVKYAIMNSKGKIIEKSKAPTKEMNGESLDDLVISLAGVYKQFKDSYDIEGIAMSLPGQIDVEKGIVYGGGAIKYVDGAPLGELLSKQCDDKRVSLENDGKCAALAEIWNGNAKGCKDACVMVFGTGIGGGIVADGKVLHGKNLLAGELSYGLDRVSRADIPDFKPLESIGDVDKSYYEVPYMWSTYNSTRAFCGRVARAKNLPFDSVDGEQIYKWVEDGDELVKEMLEDYYFDIAKYCLTLYVILNPEIILIGGGICAQPAFIEGIKRYVDKLKVLSVVYSGLKVDVCMHKNDSNLLGALYNYKQLFD